MEIIDESGKITAIVYDEFREVSYSKAVWIDGFKFVFCSIDGSSVIDRIVEVSTGACAVNCWELKIQLNKSDISDALLKKLFEKLKESKRTMGEVIRDFNLSREKYLQAWLIKLVII